ncbi:MAG: sulfurtransferase complex subunit TusD [Gammaproteobacteria bacterium]|nr:sulfurtransferase complex subunit TusD [Gammaproteobacteria bacterium]
MLFVVQINSSPYQSQSAYTALRFCHAVFKHHELKRIFFYQDGIYNALATVAPHPDTLNLNQQWTELAREHHVDLLVCISAAQLRGLHSDKTGQSCQPSPGFRIGGMGEMAEAMIEADRFMVF